MKRILSMTAISALALTAACAPGPDSIAAVPMGNAFAATSCTQASALLAQERSKLASLEEMQRGNMVADAVTTFVFLVPQSAVTGKNRAGEIGTTKGKVMALEQRMMSC
jgi:hypothetical protein